MALANALRQRSSADAPQKVAEAIADVTMGLTLPETQALVNGLSRRRAQFDIMRVALVLETYWHRHGRYPDRLEDLAPRNPASVPRDPFSGEPLRYRRQDNRYVLYSLGLNEVDNGGPRPDGRHSDDIGLIVQR